MASPSYGKILLSVMTFAQPINEGHSIGWRNPMETCKHQPTEIAKRERFGGFLRSTLSSWPRQRPYRSSSPASSCRPIPQLLLGLPAGSQSNALTPSRLLRLSKNLPHDWEQRRFLGFAAEPPSKSRRNAPHPTTSKTASRDPAAVRAPHPYIWRLWLPPMHSPAS